MEMKYTVRFAHLEYAPKYKVGDTIKRGDVIGKMGSSGQSTAKHLHLDGAVGFQDKKYQLEGYDRNEPQPIPLRQLLLFVDAELFGWQSPVVTTPYAEVEYFIQRKKIHYGFDLVPQNRHDPKADLLIYWNRSVTGKVLAILDDPTAYGHCIYIGFEA
jgi:hypothetical protein